MSVSSNLEWLNLNSQRAFPLKEDTSLVSLNGLEELPLDLVIDLVLTVPSAVSLPIKIGHVSNTGALLSIVLVDSNRAGLAFVTIPYATTTPGQTFKLSGVNPSISGSITFGEGITAVQAWDPGNRQYDADIERSALVLLDIDAVTSISESRANIKLYGDVKLEAGDNVSLTYDFDTNSIVIAVLDPEGFDAECERGCEPNKCFRTPILTINGENPTTVGNFFLQPENANILVSQSAGRIVVQSDLEPADICDNKFTAPNGRPGGLGAVGGNGVPGKCVCDSDDPSCRTIIDRTGTVVKC